ncbi:MAG: TIM barrel protein [Bryobacterales bacterium]|nr:TIM barrel protein [Bryobacterales bacterium]
MLTRRSALAGLAASAAAGSLVSTAAEGPALPVCAFSKHFQWTSVEETASLCKELGYDGVDLTVREGGHVLPSRVAHDLPRAVEIVRKAGLSTPMVTAGIVDAASPHAETILKTLASLGIKRYRWGGFRWDEKQKPEAQISSFYDRTKQLDALNRAHGMCAMYHTHSGPGQFGNAFWDIFTVTREFARESISINFDIGHATVEGGFGAWMSTSRMLLPYSRGIAVKDFYWEKNARGVWAPRWCALGKGMVNLPRFFGYVKEAGFTGPIQLHLEYPEMGDAHTGKGMTIERSEFLRLMRADIATLRGAMRQAGLA